LAAKSLDNLWSFSFPEVMTFFPSIHPFVEPPSPESTCCRKISSSWAIGELPNQRELQIRVWSISLERVDVPTWTQGGQLEVDARGMHVNGLRQRQPLLNLSRRL